MSNGLLDLRESCRKQDPKNLSTFINRPALGILPPKDFVDKLQSSLMSIAPTGLTEIQTMACGSCSVENALKAACFRYKSLERKGAAPTPDEVNSCLMNQSPGSPKLTIMSFKGEYFRYDTPVQGLIDSYSFNLKADFTGELLEP